MTCVRRMGYTKRSRSEITCNNKEINDEEIIVKEELKKVKKEKLMLRNKLKEAGEIDCQDKNGWNCETETLFKCLKHKKSVCVIKDLLLEIESRRNERCSIVT